MSESIKIAGKVLRIGETTEYGSNGFTKREMVIEVEDGQYSNKIPVEAVKDKCAMFDDVNECDTVSAEVNLRSNEWKERFFLSLQCWKIEVTDKASEGGYVDGVRSAVADAKEETDDDLPF